ncbi:MAG TPA: hypothetical protein VM513_17810 [Kofleriaceae bacterium]|nr:hypothetical protein [Kofleriaceae bacterium]
MLHLLARIEVVLAGRLLGLVADAVLAAERGQRRIRELKLMARDQLLVNAHEIAAALGVKREDVVPVRLGALGARERRRLGAAVAQDAFASAA